MICDTPFTTDLIPIRIKNSPESVEKPVNVSNLDTHGGGTAATYLDVELSGW